MSDSNIVVAVCDAHTEAEQAVRDPDKAGFDMNKLSIVARNPHAEEHVVGFCNPGDRIKHLGKTGAFWSGIWGLLFGAGARDIIRRPHPVELNVHLLKPAAGHAVVTV
jgi:hypothetical protein